MLGATYEIKLDGYRMIAVRNDKPELYSRLKNSNTSRFPEIATALISLPHGTVIDGELVAIDNDGRPNFNLLQNYRSSEAHLVYFAFDILAHKGKSLLELPLVERRKILRDVVEPNERVQLAGSAPRGGVSTSRAFNSAAMARRDVAPPQVRPKQCSV